MLADIQTLKAKCSIANQDLVSNIESSDETDWVKCAKAGLSLVKTS